VDKESGEVRRDRPPRTMSRSLKKGPFVHPKLMKKVLRNKETGSREAIKTWSRASTILPEMVNLTFMVYNGKTHLKVFVTEDMVGHKLGEFSPTRTYKGHTGHRKQEATAAAK
jgi:small subunit ribosomal protein S19